jgi:regulator of sigma E protease
MLIFLIVLFGLSILILGHEAGHFLCAKLFGLKVDEFGIGFPPRIFAWRPKKNKGTPQETESETEYSVNWLPFGGFVRISGERGEFAMVEDDPLGDESTPRAAVADTSRLFFAQPAWKKSIIIIAGIVVNFIFGWLLISAVLMVGTPQTLVITGTEPGSPAAAAHIEAGDVVKNFTTSQSFIDYIDAHAGQPTQVALIRNDKEIDLTMTPRENVGPNEGRLGVVLAEGGTTPEAFLPALRDGLQSSFLLSGMIFQTLWRLIKDLFSHGTLLAGVVGPVGIFGMAEETGKIGMMYLVQLLGIISLNLAAVNLIPFPALDGGRFLMIIIEKIKGSAIPEKVEAWVNGLGFAFLLLLMILLTVRDVRGLF